MNKSSWIGLIIMTMLVFCMSFFVTWGLTWIYDQVGKDVFCGTWAGLSALAFGVQGFFRIRELSTNMRLLYPEDEVDS